MPFTLSHAIYSIPIKLGLKRWTSVTGLIIGSIVPDFEKFIKMKPGNTFSHTWEGIFWFNLPLAIGLSFVFHGLVRNAVIDGLPEPFRKRLIVFKKFDWVFYFKKNYHVICISIIIGAFFHIALDAIVGDHGRLVKNFLNAKDFIETNASNKIFHSFIIDFITAFLGLIAISIYILHLPPKEIPKRSVFKKLSFWFLGLFIAIIIIYLRVLGGGVEGYWEFLYTTLSAFMLGIIMSSIFTSRISKLPPKKLM